uniref:Xylulose kinase-1 n=1 Tax=Tanacetum cinerariifolium TaxID=118510 RepID=A0A6L2JYR7_TANCI|nr:hypothetical protein [Tanacetum cinerariifolium]
MTTPTFTKTYNLIAYLAKPTESEGFEQIIDFLIGSAVRYALTASPTIHTSCIKQFWSTAKVKTVNDEVRVQALIDAKRVTIKESSILRTLKLDDEEGISCLANDDIFTGLANMGYKKMSDKLTFYKAFFSPQWNALVLKLPPGMNLAALWHQQSSVLPQTRSLTSQIAKLEDKVHKLEKENMILKEKSFKSAKSDIVAHVEDTKESFKQGRIIANMDEDVEVNLEEAQAKAYNLDLQHSKKVLSMKDSDEEEPAEVKEVLEIITTAKIMTEVVTTTQPTTAAQVPKASAPRKRKGVIIQDPKETAASVIVHKRQNIEVMRYQALKRKPLTEAQARKNMLIYLKNIVAFKINFFKGMTYSEIRPLFKKNYNSIKAFLEKEEKEVTVQEKEIDEEGSKRQGKSIEQDIAKKQRMDKEAGELKRNLHIMANDDDYVYTEATPLASKNFDKEDLETFWKLVKERFETREPKNFSDNFLLNILKIMFEKPNVEAIVWRDQKGKYGLAKKYPLTHFTLQQMLDNVRLEVKKESEMSLELLRYVVFFKVRHWTFDSSKSWIRLIELYKALVNSYNVVNDLFELYGKAVSLKRGRKDKDKDKDPPAGSD